MCGVPFLAAANRLKPETRIEVSCCFCYFVVWAQLISFQESYGHGICLSRSGCFFSQPPSARIDHVIGYVEQASTCQGPRMGITFASLLGDPLVDKIYMRISAIKFHGQMVLPLCRFPFGPVGLIDTGPGLLANGAIGRSSSILGVHLAGRGRVARAKLFAFDRGFIPPPRDPATGGPAQMTCLSSHSRKLHFGFSTLATKLAASDSLLQGTLSRQEVAQFSLDPFLAPSRGKGTRLLS